jgi:aminocarboxymuconate-semialdehyde decarboxylase
MTEQWNKYAPTAARRHGKPGRERRPSSTAIDTHSHVAVPAAAACVKRHLDPIIVALTHFADAATVALSQKQEADIRSRITGYDERRHGCDGHRHAARPALT